MIISNKDHWDSTWDSTNVGTNHTHFFKSILWECYKIYFILDLALIIKILTEDDPKRAA